MSFRKILKAPNWQYAIGEILLLFIGITAAIWFNNWNEHQKANRIETKTLIELKEAITKDMLDVEENILGFKNRVEVYHIMLDHLEKHKPLSDTLQNLFPYLQGLTTFLSNSGPYETLKSRGLEIITNDSIRLKISGYYDLGYEHIHSNEIEHHQHYRLYIKPKLMQHFSLKDYRLLPLDYEALKADFEFIQIIYWARRTDSFMLDIYEKMYLTGTDLLKNLEEEIKRLK